MSDHSPKKKDFLQSKPPLHPSTTLSQSNKIKPRTCLLSERYITSSEKNYKNLTLKRRYHRKLHLLGEPCSSKNDKEFLKTYKKMKYVRDLEIGDFSSFYDSFFKRMSKFRDVMVDLEQYHRWLPSGKGAREKAGVDLIRKGQKLRRLNLVSLRVKMINDVSITFAHLSAQFASVMKGIVYMSCLKELSIDVKKEQRPVKRAYRGDKPFIPEKISSRFKRLKKLEGFRVTLHDFPERILNNFTEGLECFPNLKSVDIATLDQVHSKKLLQYLPAIQTLTSVALREFAEPNDIILFASKVPTLRTIAIKSDWIFSQFNVPALESLKDQRLGLQQLHIYVPLKIDLDRDAIVVANFIDAFPQLRSLILKLEVKDHKNILSPVGKAINNLQMLEDIKLSVLVRFPGVQNPLLSSLVDLKELRKITLILAKNISHGWDKDIIETDQALRALLLSSKKLEDLRIQWNGFTEKCFEHLSLILKEMNELNLFELDYEPAHANHGTAHNDTLKSIEEYFSNTNTTMKRVVISGRCAHVRGKTCNETVVDVNEAIKSNQKIDNFVLTVGRFGLFYPSFV